MINPVEMLDKEEIKRLAIELETLGYEGVRQRMLEKGWTPESATILADAIMKSNAEILKPRKRGLLYNLIQKLRDMSW